MIFNLKRSWTVVAFVMLFSGCYEEEAPEHGVARTATGIWVASTLFAPAEESGFDYLDWLSRAEAYEEEALHKLFDYTISIKGTAFRQHGTVLLELLSRIGDENFAKSISEISNETRRAIAIALKAGTEEARKPMLRKALSLSFPVTASALEVTEEP